MQVIFIRHGATAGNAERRYIGATDQPLTESGIAAIRGRSYPTADLVIASPLTRCLQTAAIIYPGKQPIIIHDLREMDFGKFENCNYRDLQHNPDYQKWLDSGGSIPFPEGEHPEEFRRRCREAFVKTMNEIEGSVNSVAFVVHGGTIMAILSGLTEDPADYFSYMADNGGGYTCRYENGTLKNITKLFD